MAGLPARGKKTYHGLQSAVAQHLQDLSVLLPVLLKGKLTLLITVVRLGQYKPGSGGAGWGRESHSFSFFPLRLFFPPFPLFFGIVTIAECAAVF